MDHQFHAKTFTVSVVSMLFFSGLVASTYIDLSVCPMDREGKKLGSNQKITSIFHPDFRLFPCHLVDVCVHVYIIFFTVFMIHKYIVYKRENFHYFFLDYCYFHNTSFMLLMMYAMFHITNDGNDDSYGYGIPLGIGDYRFDIKPIGVSVSLLSEMGRKIYIFCFFALLSGSCGALLGALYLWKNALWFASEDKMTSSYLHLAVPTVQILLLHGAMISTANRATSTSKDIMKSCFNFSFLVGTHFAMFLLWQIVYHTVTELRTYQRKQKVKKLLKQGYTVDSTNLSKRISSFSWMMERPPGGKTGIAYRFVTCLGKEEYKTKFMFSVTQAIIHFVLLCVAFVPIKLSAYYWDVWPLLLYLGCFFVFTIRNAAILLKRWIQRLEREAELGRKLVEQDKKSGADGEEKDEKKKKDDDDSDSDSSSCSSSSSSSSSTTDQRDAAIAEEEELERKSK